MNNIDPSGLWKENVHNKATISWVKEVGFMTWQAEILGYGSHNVDWTRETMPYVGDNSWHVKVNGKDSRKSHARRERKKAIKAWKAGNKGCSGAKAIKREEALWALGKGLHPLQDVYSHGNIKWHAPFIHFFDEINYDWKKGSNKTKVERSSSNKGKRYWQTKKATKKYLKKFIKKIGGKNKLIF